MMHLSFSKYNIQSSSVICVLEKLKMLIKIKQLVNIINAYIEDLFNQQIYEKLTQK